MGSEPILLGSYAAKQCPVRVHNDFNRLIPKIPWEPAPDVAAILAAGRDFEVEMFGVLRRRNPDAVVIEPELRRQAAVERTMAAMTAGAPLILGGWLPDDAPGGRTGKPDILIRCDQGYLPADVKRHGTLKSAKKTAAVVSSLSAPADRHDLPRWSSAAGHRFEDGMQLAHYTRMLQACGHHGGPLIGAILGTTAVPEPVFVWHALDQPMITTFSRSQGSKQRSLLECYDHEHAFRLRVADTALQMVGGPDDPEPLVRPIGQQECGRCPYQDFCADQLGPHDPSTAMTRGRLSPREYRALRRLGVETTAALATIDVDDPAFFDEYFADVSNIGRDRARKNLRQAVRRAAMICEGVEIERVGTAPVAVPSADIEIDLDVENGADNRVYMWGVRIRDGHDDATARYLTDFVEWAPLDDEGERRLAGRFVAWLRALRRDAAEAGRTVAVFHWADHEISRLKGILGLAAVGDLIDRRSGIFVDLRRSFDAEFFSLHGSSLKVIAPVFGFQWSVADPGGLMSQVHLAAVHAGQEREAAAAKRWLLAYNADDTAATAAVRDGMRRW